MNWQYRFIILFVVAFSITSCKKNKNDDMKLQPLETAGAFFVDTFSINAFNIQKDSTISSHRNINSHLVGVLNSEDFGQVTASTITQLNLPSGGVNFNNGAELVSAKLYLWKNYYYGVKDEDISILINEVNDQLDYEEDGETTRYYVFDKVSIGDYLDEFVFNSSLDSIELELSNKFSNKIFNLSSGEISSQKDLNALFSGFTLQPYQGEGVLGFDLSKSYIQVNYTLEGQNLFENFYLNSEVAHFNRISYDRSGTEIANLSTNNEELHISNINNKMFIQAGTRAEGLINLPTLNSLYESDQFIYKAELEIPVELFPYTSTSVEPLNLFVYDTSGLIVGIESEQLQLLESKYIFDFTEHVQNVIAGEYQIADIEVFTSQIGHKVFGFYIDQPEDNIKLKIYFSEK